MTYAPLWPDWDTKTHNAISDALAELDVEQADLARTIGEIIGDDLAAEFCDVDRSIVGWVAMRTASHLGGIAEHADPSILALVGMLAGQHVQAGAV